MSFHLFHINEVFSNATGTVQFVEFVGDANIQHFWAGHSILSTNDITSNTYSFGTDLPGSATAGKAVLIATQGFADLGIVAPDYIIPDGFLFTTNGAINFPGMIGGAISYAALPVDGTTSLNRDGSTGVNSPTNFVGNTGTIFSNVISGTNGADNLTGTPGADIINAGDGLDRLNGVGGNDTLEGGLGIDTAIYSGNRANYTIATTSSGFNISGSEGDDTLSGIERLQFADTKLAMDLNNGQAANNTARIIGAAFGVPAITEHPDYVTIGLNLFDSGQTVLEVSELAVNVLDLSNDEFVDAVYQNVVGAAPAPAVHDFYVSLLQGSGGSSNQAQLMEIGANSVENALNIDLAGLAQNGVVFI